MASRRRATDAQKTRITGYWTLFWGPKTDWARYKYDWPFGVIEVRDRELVLDVHQPLGGINRAVLRLLPRRYRSRFPLPLVIPLDAIDSLRVNWGRLGSAMISSSDPVFGCVNFGGFRPAFERILSSLQTQGVEVIRPPGESARATSV